MNRRLLNFIFCAVMVCLWGCGAQSPVDSRIQVTLLEIPGCTVENNGQWVEPGADAVFVLDLDPNTTLADTDYPGEFSAEVQEGKLELTLRAVQYPIRVKPELTREYCAITYHANGGEGRDVTKTYDLRHHLRPNTELGRDLFTREGYTLVCWNTEPDGSGVRVGLGSRVTVDQTLTLYAQWAKWSDPADFEYLTTNYNTINLRCYTGSDETVVIPEYIDGRRVTGIMPSAFADSGVRHLVVSPMVERIASDAFQNCTALESVVLYDNLQMIYNDSFVGCENLRTLYINAVEAPWGYEYRKESVYPDKVDRLILAQGQKKMVFYGGCSVWYNLDGAMADAQFGEEYAILNLGLNGTINSAVQMQILEPYLEEGDLLVHTLEVASQWQMMQDLTMSRGDDKFWAGVEYNYDLFSLVDLRTVSGVFESWLAYLDQKKEETDYQDYFTDSQGRVYLDEYGCVPFLRDETKDTLTDQVRLDPTYVDEAGMAALERQYRRYEDRGVQVYVTFACVNMDALPPEQQGNAQLLDELVRQAVAQMEGPVLISRLEDYLYTQEDFYDTNYHLRTVQTQENTARWLRDLQSRMILDGLWEEDVT